jgi:hypothetical protein
MIEIRKFLSSEVNREKTKHAVYLAMKVMCKMVDLELLLCKNRSHEQLTFWKMFLLFGQKVLQNVGIYTRALKIKQKIC